jgi:Mrp family chromosome partitioning ATPase
VKASGGLAVMSVGFLLNDGASPVIWRGPRKHGVIRQFLRDVLWGKLDDLVIDAPPGTGDEPLAVAELAGAGSRAVIVTTAQEVAIADVRRSIGFCRELALPVAGLVENMSGLVCPHCDGEIELFGTGGGERLAGEMKVSFLGRIPFDPRLRQAGDEGRPLACAGGDGPVAAIFDGLARGLAKTGPAAREARRGQRAGTG